MRIIRAVEGLLLAGLLGVFGPGGCGKKAPPAPAAPAQAPAPAAAPAAAVSTQAAVAVSTPPAPPPPTVATYYKAERARDPFISLTAGAAAVSAGPALVVSTEQFDIHTLELRGILDSPSGDFALLLDQNSGATYVLKAGRLLDAKGKTVPGVSGRIDGKKVRLLTADKDVQELKLVAEPSP